MIIYNKCDINFNINLIQLVIIITINIIIIIVILLILYKEELKQPNKILIFDIIKIKLSC